MSSGANQSHLEFRIGRTRSLSLAMTADEHATSNSSRILALRLSLTRFSITYVLVNRMELQRILLETYSFAEIVEDSLLFSANTQLCVLQS